MYRRFWGVAVFGALLIVVATAAMAHIKNYRFQLADAAVKDDSPSTTGSDRKIKYYRNPMGLPDTSPTPKKDSMGMDYIPVYESEASDDGSIKVSPGKIQRTGVTTVMVSKRPITNTLKVPGVIQFDETRLAVVAPRFDGYVVKMGAATTGTHVKKGDILATVFSQDLLNWGARLITDQGFYGKGADDARASDGPRNDGLGASRRLENLGAPPDFIETIKRTRRVPDVLTIRAPIDGVVLERNLVDGQAFKAGDVTFRIGDHSVVWVMADVAEGDIESVRPGQSVKVTTRAYPGRVFEGKVAVIYPQLMKATRTARVRIELPNPDLALLPDMYGDVAIATGADSSVPTVPSSAVIDSGSRQVVLLDQGHGRYEPRESSLGAGAMVSSRSWVAFQRATKSSSTATSSSTRKAISKQLERLSALPAKEPRQ